MSVLGPFSHWKDAIQPHVEVVPPPPGTSQLPPVFQFSQNSLQDYADCPRRFQLRYVLGQQWPAAEAEPLRDHEHLLEQGEQFHLLVQRHFLDIPHEWLMPHDTLLREWWESFLSHPIHDLPDTFQKPEVQLSTPLGSQRLLARFDLLAIEPGQRVVIVDWKTARHRPDRQMLAARLQSHVYPFVLVEAGTHLFGGPIAPEQVSLIYWFTADPSRPEVFEYSTALHRSNQDYLTHLITEVLDRDDEVWPLTEHVKHCAYCVFRSLCDRGVSAGPLDGAPAEVVALEIDFDLILDEIEEIAF